MLGLASISIPYFKTDIKSAIKKKSKKNNLIIVIDDLERKSSNIKMEDILGIVESISMIENISIIIVANEKKINNLDDKKTYNDFKEKVIQKVYNVDKYSDSAPIEIVKKDLKNLKVSKKQFELIESAILQVFKEHQINNLRTLEKGCYFIKLLVRHINLSKLSEKEIKEIIIASLAVVIEQTEGLYISLEKEKNKNQEKNSQNKLIENIFSDVYTTLTNCIIKNYFKESVFISNKSTLIDAIANIYSDINVFDNYNQINKFYTDLHIMKNEEDEKNSFYLSEEHLKVRINDFYNNYVVKVDKSINLNNWLKKLIEIYHYSTIIGMQDIWEDENIFNAMDLYLEDLETDKGLYNLLEHRIFLEIKDEKIKQYIRVLDKKIIERYYDKCLDEIISNTSKGIYEQTQLDTLFSIYTENNANIDKQGIINKIKENKYFIPNLNYDISEKMWSFAHTIWEKARNYKELRDDSFEKCVKELLKTSTTIGKYRIESLNEQYDIII